MDDAVSRKIAQEQVNIRIDADLLEILEAAAFVERASVAELARGAIEGLARSYRSESRVQLALEARKEQEAEIDRS
jgi:hypothetical protein